MIAIQRPEGVTSVMWLMRCDCGSDQSVAAEAIVKKGRALSCVACTNRMQGGSSAAGWRGFGHVTGVAFGHWRNSAAVREIEFTVTIEYIAAVYESQNGRCAVSGRELIFKRGRCIPGATASLDRIESDRGYVPGNVQLVTKDVNFAKQRMSNAELITLARDIVCFAERVA